MISSSIFASNFSKFGPPPPILKNMQKVYQISRVHVHSYTWTKRREQLRYVYDRSFALTDLLRRGRLYAHCFWMVPPACLRCGLDPDDESLAGDGRAREKAHAIRGT